MMKDYSTRERIKELIARAAFKEEAKSLTVTVEDANDPVVPDDILEPDPAPETPTPVG